MAAITVDHRELKQLAADVSDADKAMVLAAQTALKVTSFAVEKRVKLEMPVDTGRARASWGHWTAADLVLGRKGNDAGPGDSVWREEAGGLSITQGSNVEYVEALNSGHSRQRAAGFIDRAGLFGQLTLEEELGLIDPLSQAYAGRRYLALFG